MPTSNSYKLLESLVKYYRKQKNDTDELEIRFKTAPYNTLTRIDFDNVINKLRNLGFENEFPNGHYRLNIWNEFAKSGKFRMSNIRTELHNIYNVQKFCKTNQIDIEDNSVKFVRKHRRKISEIDYNTIYNPDGKKSPTSENSVQTDRFIAPVDFNDFEFRVNYKTEEQLNKSDRIVSGIMQNWSGMKKKFRFIKRYSFKKQGVPFKIDCSIVKTSSRELTYKITDSQLFNSNEHYEIEIEFTESRLSLNEVSLDLEMKLLKSHIKHILSAIQNSNYPISNKKQYGVAIQYIKTAHPKINIEEKLETLTNKYKYHNELTNKRYFIGPSSISLELNNIIKKRDNNEVVNIREPYTVTDKADGIRKLLFIAENKEIYLIDVNMHIEYTGCKTQNSSIVNTIIDGEHVKYDKNGNYINTYLCFDIYFVNGESVREYPLLYYKNIKYNLPEKEADKMGERFRMEDLQKVIKTINLSGYNPNVKPPMMISVKKFYHNMGKQNNIFKQCANILNQEDEDGFRYEIDGLIFTPINKSVGSNQLGVLDNVKTWRRSFKWKPPEYNTIDFLVRTVKDKTGNDVVNHIYENGTNVINSNIVKYKSLVLHVGFSKSDGFINPWDTALNIDSKNKNSIESLRKSYNSEDSNYYPAPFKPTNPTPTHDLHICNIKLINGNMYTEDKNDMFGDDTIVEFKYEKNNLTNWEWVPIRVRYDKTADYRKTRRNFGNSYKVACSVWRSINFPITKKMITGKVKLPTVVDDNEIYYKKKETSENPTESLRHFHNKYVKMLLVKSACKRKDTLFDMSVGRGGDIYKWVEADLAFVLGVDVAKDNIHNKADGVCSRYLKAKMKYSRVFDGIFMVADATKNFKNGDAFSTPKEVEIMKSLLGTGGKSKELGLSVYNNYQIAKEGFNVVSNQFSMHYFFGNLMDVHNFAKNVSQNCKLNGYFIGTTFDGEKIFNMLKDKEMDDSICLYTEDKYGNQKKVWEVIKKFDKQEFLDNPSSLGYRIDVYQESINKYFPEYLVNFSYFKRLMELYGFEVLTPDELDKLSLRNSVDSFEYLFNRMLSDKRHKIKFGNAYKMKDYEKTISFLNNYFILKKTRSVNEDEVMNIALTGEGEDIKVYERNKTVKKLGMKFKLPRKNVYNSKKTKTNIKLTV